MSMVRVGVRILGAIVLFGLGSQAFAQPPKSVAAAPAAKPERPVDAEPNSTVASFGDWTLRCQIRAQDQQNPMAELAVGRLKKADPLRLTIVAGQYLPYEPTGLLG